MEVMGQAMDTHTTSTNTFTFKAAGTKDKNFLLGVILDDIVVTVTSSAQGDLSPDMASVKGKSFNMVLSPLGSEVDVAGADITYEMGGESRNLSSGFKHSSPISRQAGQDRRHLAVELLRRREDGLDGHHGQPPE